MAKLCKDCVHYGRIIIRPPSANKDTPGYMRLVCNRPMGMGVDIVTGEPIAASDYVRGVYYQRYDGLIASWLAKTCGKRGRYWKAKGDGQ